jgi:hypothetical protein
MIDSWFIEADETFKGHVGGAEAVKFMKRSNLSKEVLREVWSLADNQKTGRLNRTQFFFAIRLITILCSPIYAGSKPSVDLYNSTVNKRIPLPSQLNIKPEPPPIEKPVVEEEQPKLEAPSLPAATQQSHVPVMAHHDMYHPQQQGHQFPAPHQYPPAIGHFPQQQHPPGYGGYPSGVYSPHPPVSVPQDNSSYTHQVPGYHGIVPSSSATYLVHPVPAHQYQSSSATANPSVANTMQVHEDEEFSDFTEASAVVPPLSYAAVSSVSPMITQPQSNASSVHGNAGNVMSPDISMKEPLSVQPPQQQLEPQLQPHQTNAVEEDDDEFSDFAGATVSHQTIPDLPVSSPVPPVPPVPLGVDETNLLDSPIQQQSVNQSMQKEVLLVENEPSPYKPSYDASKLSIFDDMVENDLAALQEDWDDFADSNAAVASVLPTPPQVVSIEPVSDASSKSINPFDEFGDIELNDDFVVSSVAFNSTNLSEATMKKNIDTAKADEDFGDFETHSPHVPNLVPIPILQLERQDSTSSVHYSEKSGNLKHYFHHPPSSSAAASSSLPEHHAFPSILAPSSAQFDEHDQQQHVIGLESIHQPITENSKGSLAESSPLPFSPYDESQKTVFECCFNKGDGLFVDDSIHRSEESNDLVSLDLNSSLPSPSPSSSSLPVTRPESSTFNAIEKVEEDEEGGSAKTVISYSDMIDTSRSHLGSDNQDESMKSDYSRMTSNADEVLDFLKSPMKEEKEEEEKVEMGDDDFSISSKDYFSGKSSMKNDNKEESSRKEGSVAFPLPSHSVGIAAVDDHGEDDPFAELSKDIIVPVLPEIKHDNEVDQVNNDPLEVKPSLSLNDDNAVMNDNDNVDEMEDDFQDFTSFKEDHHPSVAAAVAVVASTPIQTQIETKSSSKSNKNLIDDLMNLYPSAAPTTTLPSSTSTSSYQQPPAVSSSASSRSAAVDLLSLDFLSAPYSAAPSVVHSSTDFDPFSHNSTTVPPIVDNSNVVTDASFEADFDNDDFDPFVSATPETSSHPPVVDLHPTVTTAPMPSSVSFADHQHHHSFSSGSAAPTSLKENKVVVPSSSSKKSETSASSISLPNLEILSVILFENNYYESSYNCSLQTLLIRQINELNELKKNAMENDELENAINYKKQIKELTTFLFPSFIEKQWQILSTMTKGISIDDYYQQIMKICSSTSSASSTSSKVGKQLLSKISLTYFPSNSSIIPDKYSPLDIKMKYYILLKRSLKIISFLLNNSWYDLYERIYVSLIPIVFTQLSAIQTVFSQFASFNDKKSIQIEIKLHSRMISFLKNVQLLLEDSIYLAVVSLELLIYDRTSTFLIENPKKENNNNNLAVKLFSTCQELLQSLEEQFDISSKVTNVAVVMYCWFFTSGFVVFVVCFFSY